MPIVVQNNFTGGVNHNRKSKANESYTIENARPMPGGYLEVRKGQVQFATVGAASSGNIQALYAFSSTTGGLHVLTVKREDGINDKIYDGSTEITGEDFGSAGDYTTITEYKGFVLLCNGETVGINIVGPGETVRSVIKFGETKPKILAIYLDRCYFAEKESNILRWSNAGMFTLEGGRTTYFLPTTPAEGQQYSIGIYPAQEAVMHHEDNYVEVGNTGDEIVQIVPGARRLIIFCKNSYTVQYGTPGDDGDIADASWHTRYGLGCISSRAAVKTSTGVFFVGTDRKPHVIVENVAYDLDPQGRVSSYFDIITTMNASQVALTYYNREVWIYLPSEKILIYNLNTKSWTVFTDIVGYSLNVAIALNRLFVGSAYGGYVWEQNVDAPDISGAIQFKFVSRPITMNQERRKKSFQRVDIQADLRGDSSWAAKYLVDNSNTEIVFGSGTPLIGTGKSWGAEQWGASAWIVSTFINQDLYFANGINQRATELKIQLDGDAVRGSRLLSYEVQGTIEER